MEINSARSNKRTTLTSNMRKWWWTYIILLCINKVSGQCPWQREVQELQAACLCAYNLGHELSVQCDQVDFPILVKALDAYAKNTPLDLLYINNSTIGRLRDDLFVNLRIHNVQLSGCKLKHIAAGAFRGQENTMKNLNLQDNELIEVPVDSLRGLSNLALLDLSKNRITKIQDNSFSTLKRLTTLKLSDNNITLSPYALKGLDGSLKNLNLKGTKQKRVPESVRGLKTLAFLDLSQNSIHELPGPGGAKTFEGLDSLTALNLERNLIQSLGENAFFGVRKTLSSLSLLNNLLAEFPTGALSMLSELRVLDIGFNLLTSLPENSFSKNPSITLLALDGNPLSTVPFKALSHLNNTLRGLSLGGRFLHCDCRLRWVTEWIRNGDLQVTSRERNPQFCGSPPRFRDRGFYSIQPDELLCENDTIGIGTVEEDTQQLSPSSKKQDIKIPTSSNTSTVSPTTSTVSTTTIEPSTSTTTKPPSTSTVISTSTSIREVYKKNPSNNAGIRSTTPPWRHNQISQRPPLILGFPPQRSKTDDSNEVIVKNAYRQDNSVIIQWDSDTANILGFRVVYRLFGDKSFKQGPPLEASEREFKIKNVPSQECIVVCVISLEEINVSPDTVPYSQCREVRTVSSATSNMDKITIAASAAICGTIVIAVIVFIAASRRRSRKMHNLQQQLNGKSGLPIGGLPVNCCAGMATTPSPGGPLSSLATLSAFNKHQDWDQVSAYSGRSIPRPRMYPLDTGNSIMNDDMRSHVSHFSSVGPGKIGKTRSIADGQSQHSFSNHSGRYLANSAFPSNLVSSRSDLRQSRQSLAGQSDRMSRMSFTGSHVHHGAPSVGSSTRRTRPRSRSRDHTAMHARPGSRYSNAGSTRTLNNICGDTSDNWTDHDMDIYMARNPTTRGGLVPL